MKTVYHIGQVLLVNLTAAWVCISHINEILTFVTSLSALAYTVFRFVRDFKKK